ncbi:MAG: UDP-3-O-(3-hydroxymyristoyl)glucosamine N-acyltransferase [Planctomycetota bacterium]
MESTTSQTVAELIGGRLVGDPDATITGLAEIGQGRPGDLTFIGEAAYAARWADSQATAAIVTEGIDAEPGEGEALIFVDNADLAMARVLDHVAPPPTRPEPGIHPTAAVDPAADVADDVTIGAFCVVGAGAVLGPGVVLHPHVTVMDRSRIGEASVLWPHVVVRERCVLGGRCVLEPGVVIGADGFGYRPGQTDDGQPRIVKVPHLGYVELGDEVEVGANTTIDRGKFGATTIGDGAKIDNLVQIGHNCRIGRLSIISGCCALAGSVVIGDGCLVGGAAVFKDHVSIGHGCKIAGGAAVITDIPDGEDWAGYPAKPAKDAFREEMAVRKLPDLLKQLRKRG